MNQQESILIPIPVRSPPVSPTWKEKVFQTVDTMIKSILNPLATPFAPPPPRSDESDAVEGRPWLPKPEPQVSKFEEPAEWHQGEVLEPIEEEMPVPEGFVRRMRNRK
jgi:hypothetical protein